MIGIVVVTHDNIAKEMVSTTKKILPDALGIVAVSISSDTSVDVNREKIAKAISDVDRGDGVMLLSDMFGGTPANLCLSFLGKGNVEVISGTNLPMLIKLANDRDHKTLKELAEFIRDYGKKNIVIASHVLEGKLD